MLKHLSLKLKNQTSENTLKKFSIFNFQSSSQEGMSSSSSKAPPKTFVKGRSVLIDSNQGLFQICRLIETCSMEGFFAKKRKFEPPFQATCSTLLEKLAINRGIMVRNDFWANIWGNSITINLSVETEQADPIKQPHSFLSHLASISKIIPRSNQ